MHIMLRVLNHMPHLKNLASVMEFVPCRHLVDRALRLVQRRDTSDVALEPPWFLPVFLFVWPAVAQFWDWSPTS